MLGVKIRESLVVVGAKFWKRACGPISGVGEESRGLGVVNTPREGVGGLEADAPAKAFSHFEDQGMVPGVSSARLLLDSREVRVWPPRIDGPEQGSVLEPLRFGNVDVSVP